jgi:capsular polysaccharide biosynthesis protein
VFYLYFNSQSVSSCSINKVDTPDQVIDGQSVLDDLDRELDRRREADQLNRN